MATIQLYKKLSLEYVKDMANTVLVVDMGPEARRIKACEVGIIKSVLQDL